MRRLSGQKQKTQRRRTSQPANRQPKQGRGLNPMLKFFGAAALMTGLLSALAFAAPSKSGLVFCNRGNQGKIHVAIALPTDKDSWATQGWLDLAPGQCETAVPGRLTNRFYYYFAETDQNYTWHGGERFCVSNDQFTFLNADTECRGRSSRWARFRELDTGEDAESYLLNLE